MNLAKKIVLMKMTKANRSESGQDPRPPCLRRLPRREWEMSPYLPVLQPSLYQVYHLIFLFSFLVTRSRFFIEDSRYFTETSGYFY